MNGPLQIHAALASIGITEATLHTTEGDYYYIAPSPTEFQLGLEGNVPTNYFVHNKPTTRDLTEEKYPELAQLKAAGMDAEIPDHFRYVYRLQEFERLCLFRSETTGAEAIFMDTGNTHCWLVQVTLTDGSYWLSDDYPNVITDFDEDIGSPVPVGAKQA